MNSKYIDLRKLNNMVLEEINRYKWIESEKSGYDIGEYKAAAEWIKKHYPEWFKVNFCS